MKGTKFFFVVSLIVLTALYVNGMYIITHSGHDVPHNTPVPISDDYDAGYETDTGYKANYETKYKTRYKAKYETKKLKKQENGRETEPVNLMLLGLDRDRTRSDVIMLINFDPESSSVNLLSIARDTRIKTGGRFRKINSLYSGGGEKRIASELSRITGLPVHYYVTADFKGFRKIIDVLGGVEFYVPFDMNYDDPTQNLHIHLRKGLHVLDGKKAEQLVRYRKGNLRGQGYLEGDIGRIKTQQDFFRALIDQKLNIKYISKASDIFAIMQEHVKTNITVSDIARFAPSAAKVKSSDVKTFVLPGKSRVINGVWWYIYDEEKTEDMITGNFKLPKRR